jgi:hypothetical protein
MFIMTQKNSLKIFPINKSSLITRMSVGALIGLILIGIFLLSADNADPAWGKFWMIRPLIIVPFAGAMGGAFNYLVSEQHYQSGWLKAFAMLFSLIVFIIGLWLGSVLGLDGTYWN